MIGLIIIPYTFLNNVETADAVKVNSNYGVVAGGVNELAAAINAASGSRDSLALRLAVALNDDGTLRASSLPVGTYDTRTRRVVSVDDDITNDDAVLLVDTEDGDVTLTLPPSVSATVMPIVVNIGKTGYSAIVVPDGSDTIMEIASYNLGVAGEFAQFAVQGSNWWRIR